ncbi:MAG: hypothetical protein CM1200mP2_41020 [Planctomycetaceae bacterium]|nr:MAG: hypothetical protein CM1200mP2_41020 [Planctomycetaceae bacterium]
MVRGRPSSWPCRASWATTALVIWTLVVAIGAAAILLSGGYNVLERVSIGLVFTFTLITIACTVLLQWTGYAVTWDDIRSGLEFRIFPGNLMAGLAGFDHRDDRPGRLRGHGDRSLRDDHLHLLVR